MIFLQYIVPQHLLSRLMFAITRIKNKWIKNTLITRFVKYYKVDLSQASRDSVEQYESFNDFFTRSLKSGVRPVARGAIVSPVDGLISECGEIAHNKILQAKNHYYSLEQLLVDSNSAVNFNNGYFATIYLSPKDYHRIHMPYNGELKSMVYVPGSLFSVNQKTTEKVPNLFARNERVICYFDTAFGECALVLVGAMFVGSIDTKWHGQVNYKAERKIQYFDYKDSIKIKKGDEIARFNMGSTVIMLMPNKCKLNLESAGKLVVGQSLRAKN